MDFIWNEIQAEDIRQQSIKAMQGYSYQIADQAETFLKAADKLQAEADALEATLDIMTTVTRRGRRELSDGSIERYEYTVQVVDVPATNAARQQIRQMLERVRDYNEAARILKEASRQLEEAIYSSNRKFDEMFRMAQYTDGRYAQRIRYMQGRIEDYIARIGDIRDSFGNKFTTEADGVVYFGSSAGSVISNYSNFISWPLMEELLARHYTDINDIQFSVIAWNFTLTSNNIRAQERFINLFLEPVNLQGIGNPYGVSAFTVCPNKIGGVQYFIEGEIGVTLLRQTGHLTGSDGYNGLQGRGNDLKGLSALLTAVNILTDHDTTNRLLTPQRVILSNGDVRPITLQENEHSTTLTLNRGIIQTTRSGAIDTTTTLQPLHSNTMTHPHGITFPNTDNVIASNITITNVLERDGITLAYLNSIGNHFYMRYQFNGASHVSNLTGGFVAGALTSGIASTARTTLEFADMLFGSSLAAAEARRLQNDFLKMTNAGQLATFHYNFALRGVVITEDGQSPMILSWPTPDTVESLAAFNTTLRNHRDNLSSITYPNDPSVITQSRYTFSELLEDRDKVFNAFSALNEAGASYFGVHRRIGWSTRQYIPEPPTNTLPNPSTTNDPGEIGR